MFHSNRPEKLDFLRMATAMDAIIVPFSSIGMSESVNFIMDRNDIVKLPFIGKMATDFESKLPQARPDVNESMIGPIVTPTIPSRFYYLFQHVSLK